MTETIDRNSYIGGSDAAVLVGESDYKDPVRLFYEKKGVLPREEVDDDWRTAEGERVRWGTKLEDAVAQEYSERTGRKVRRVPFITHPEYPFIGGHIDRDVLNVPRILEIKTHGWFVKDKYGDVDEGADAVPAFIKTQCYHYFQLKPHAEFCDVAVLFGGNEMKIFELPRPEGVIEALTELEVDFWDRLAGDEPPPFNPHHKATQKLLKELYPHSNGIVIEIPDELMPVHEEYVKVYEKLKGIRKQERDTKDDLTILRNKLEAAMGDSPIMRTPGGGGYTRKWVEKSGHVVEPHRYPLFTHKKKVNFPKPTNQP